MFNRSCPGSGAALGRPLVTAHETGSTNDDALGGGRRPARPRSHVRRRHTDPWTRTGGGTPNLAARRKLLTFLGDIAPEPSPLSAERVSATVARHRARGARRHFSRARVSTSIKVKWPNDVVVGRKKLAGILVESRVSGTTVDAIVVGIGINVHMRELPDDIAAVATFLSLLDDPSPSREAVLRLDELRARGSTRLASERLGVAGRRAPGIDAPLGSGSR